MKEKQNLDSDIIRFFKDIEDQTESDKMETLRLLMDKYIHLTKATYLMDKYDLSDIISLAKKIITEKTLPLNIGRSPVHESEIANLCVVEATINHLNNKGCLKKLAKFDYNK